MSWYHGTTLGKVSFCIGTICIGTSYAKKSRALNETPS